MILIPLKRLVLQISIALTLLHNTTLYSQQLDISTLNKEQLKSTIDSVSFKAKNSGVLLQLLKRSKELQDFSAQYDILHKLGSYYFVKAEKDSSLYYFNTSEYIYESVSLTEKSIEKLYLDKGRVLMRMGLISRAIEYFTKAYEIYLESGDYTAANGSKMNISFCYSELKEYDKSITIIKEVLNDSSHIDDLMKMGGYNGISIAYDELKEYDEAIKWVRKGIDIANRKENFPVLSILYSNLGLYHSGKKEYKKALEYGFKGQKLADSIGYHRNEGIENGNLGGYYLGLEKYAKAEEYLTKGIEGNTNYDSLKEIYTNFIELYQQQNKPEKEISMYETYTSLLDSVAIQKDIDYINTVDKQRELIEQEYKNKELLAENKWIIEKNAKQKIAIIGLLIIVIISLLCIYLLYKYKKNRQVISELKSSEKQLLEEQIRLRDNELDASAIAIAQRVEVLNTIKEELETIKDDNPKLVQVNKTVKNLIQSSSDISLVTDRIESQYPTLTIELKNKHPELSDTEIRYCLLTKLNLSLKETAAMLNVTPNTVKVTRSRLKKKMDIHQEVSFKEYLDKICVHTVASL
ncbi:hypothetical protein [Aquimarina sp. RZ0]|uniref:tetratricopeptide repeat protein n=1 Tax=Aquimarina sp. RZ0 TaxID=2607730 RepID=UPI00165ED00A|nr:hypothetical protein [Aquimarina sp. RZ0]